MQRKPSTGNSGHFGTVLTAGGIIAAAIIYKVFFAESGKGGGKGAAQNAIDCGHLPNTSYPLEWYETAADGIEGALYDGMLGLSEDDQAAANILMLARTTDDVLQLVCAYDVRGRGVLIGEYYNLPQAVARFLDTSDIDEVNAYYRENNINFQW